MALLLKLCVIVLVVGLILAEYSQHHCTNSFKGDGRPSYPNPTPELHRICTFSNLCYDKGWVYFFDKNPHHRQYFLTEWELKFYVTYKHTDPLFPLNGARSRFFSIPTFHDDQVIPSTFKTWNASILIAAHSDCRKSLFQCFLETYVSLFVPILYKSPQNIPQIIFLDECHKEDVTCQFLEREVPMLLTGQKSAKLSDLVKENPTCFKAVFGGTNYYPFLTESTIQVYYMKAIKEFIYKMNNFDSDAANSIMIDVAHPKFEQIVTLVKQQTNHYEIYDSKLWEHQSLIELTRKLSLTKMLFTTSDSFFPILMPFESIVVFENENENMHHNNPDLHVVSYSDSIKIISKLKIQPNE